MKVVRQRMIKPFSSMLPSLGLAFVLPILGALTSCNPTEITPKGARSSVVTNDGSFDNKAFVYEESPFYIAGPTYGPNNVDMSSFLAPKAKLITTNNRLTGNCEMIFSAFTSVTLNDCIHSLVNSSVSSQPAPRQPDRTYIFPPNSPEFYQTNALYHITLGANTFFEKLSFAYLQAEALQARSLPFDTPRSIPSYLSSSRLFWFKAMSSIDKRIFNFDYLTTHALCEFNGNASFSPAGPTICLGGFDNIPNFHFVQDPTVIYHELGHALVSVMMNMRNGTNSSTYHKFRSNLGSFGYNEAGSINEGIADYFAYIMNRREDRDLDRMGEFTLGRFANQARPYTEAHPSHISGLEETPEGRLSYPNFLLYDPNFPEESFEAVHYAGQIISHYLVALTKELKNECGLTSDADKGHGRATSYVMLLLAETLSELGDLNARGMDFYSIPLTGSLFFNNLNDEDSFLWTQTINPVSYRRFSQVMAKNILKYMQGQLCPAFDKNKSEKLLDDYGLLLFKTYNNNGTSTTSTIDNYQTANPSVNPAALVLTPVSENNRRKSVLISKELMELAERSETNPDRVGFYIVDNSTDIASLLQNLLFKGFTVPVSKGVAGTEYNNNNIKVSPGEVVAIIPNLYNNSNSTMAGVQLLATDWDHVHVTDTATGNFQPCVIDNVTTQDQGGKIKDSDTTNTCNSTDPDYRRLIKNSSGFFPPSAAAPVCLVELDDGVSTKWVSQNEFRKKQGLSLMDKDCLGYSTSPSTVEDFSFNPHECLVRFLPGANAAQFSKIDPQKTYYETVVKESDTGSFNSGNILLMEVNKWIPPGTKFRCRLRARFSNCSDCYTDGSNNNDDFIDAELNGEKPFKVINFEFDVND